MAVFSWNLVDSNQLVSLLNAWSQDVLGWKFFTAISMYQPTSHIQALLVSVVSYLVVIFGLRHFLKVSKIDLRTNSVVNRFAFVHNVFMSIFSLYMFVDAVVKIHQHSGWGSLDAYLRIGGSSDFHALHDLFYWSKFIELIDTVILVVKDKPLGFLHVFHHCTTASVSYVSRFQPLWMGTWTNGLVHVFMYAHFARPFSFIRQYLTTMQIVQFIFILVTYNYWWWAYANIPLQHILWGDFCYAVYLVFFCKFFYDNYISPKGKQSRKPISHKKEQ